MSGKCPKCEKPVMRVTIDTLDGSVFMGSTYRMLSYKCPWCQTVLGIQMDPVALKTDTAEAVIKRLR